MQNKLRTFYTLVLTQTFSQIGSQMSGFAIGIWVFQKTGNTTPLLLVGVFEMLPFMLAGSFAGVLADRWNRKRMLIGADTGQALASLFLLGSFLSGNFELWHLYTASFVSAIFAMLQEPVNVATIPLLVPEGELERANAIRQITGPAAGLVAPILAGFLYAFVDVEGVILIDLITFLVAVGVVFTLTIPQPNTTAEGDASRGSMLYELFGAFRFLWERQALLGLLIYFTFCNFVFTGVFGLTTPYFLTLTDNNEKLVGVFLGLLNIGMVIGGISMGMWQRKASRMNIIMRLMVTQSAVLILYGVVRSPVAIGVMALFLLVPIPMINAMITSIFQTKIPPDMQGRVFAALMQISMFAIPFSKGITGPLIDKVLEPAVNSASWWDTVAPIVGREAGAGMGLYSVFGGIILVVVSLLVYSVPKIRSLEADLPDYKPTQEAPLEENMILPDEPDKVSEAGETPLPA